MKVSNIVPVAPALWMVLVVLGPALLPSCQLLSEMPYKSTLEAIALREDQRVLVSEIEPYLSYDNTNVRLRAAMALARLRHEAAVDFIASHLDREIDSRVTETMLFALGQINSPKASPTIIKFFASSIETVRASAVEAAGKVGDLSLTPPLIERLKDPSPYVRAEACIALFRLGAKRYTQVHGKLDDEVRVRRQKALIHAMLNDKYPDVRWRATYALCGIEDPGSADALRKAMMKDVDIWVRTFAARGLSAMPNRPAIQKALSEACEIARQRGEWQVAVEAIKALGNYADLETAAFLINCLIPGKNSSLHVRAAAARTLGRFQGKGETIVKALIRATNDPARTVVGEAIIALGSLEGTWSIIEEAAESADRIIRLKAVQAAAQMGVDGQDILLDLAESDESIRVRCAALEVLSDPQYVELNDEITTLAEAAVTIDDLSLRSTGADLLKALGAQESIPVLQRAYFRSFAPEMGEARLKIIEALTSLMGMVSLRGEPVDVEVIRKAVLDEDYHVRSAASKALATISGELVEIAPPTFERRVVPVVDEDYINNESNPVAQVSTNKGDFWIELFKDDAPTHVLNFIQLAEDGTYDKLGFHRVVTNFVVQGLDPRGDGWGFNNIHLRDEINRRKYLRGYVGMPNSGRDTGGCQIFITHCPTPHLDGNYTILGRVIDGMGVVDNIEEGDRVFGINLK